MVGFIGRGQHLALIDVVDVERLEDLCFGEVPDACLGHHRDRHGCLDALDQLWIAHARHATVATDVGGNPLECHHRDRSGVLGDLGLLGVDHIHDHTASEHVCEAALDPEGPSRAAVVVRGRARIHGSHPTGVMDLLGLPLLESSSAHAGRIDIALLLLWSATTDRGVDEQPAGGGIDRRREH